MQGDKTVHSKIKVIASDGPIGTCGHPLNFHAANEVNGPRDGVCRVEFCECAGGCGGA